MKIRGRLLWSVLFPALVLAATSEQREYTQVMAATPDAEHGAVLFQRCVVCHGADGGGQVSGSVPRIAGQHFSVIARQIVEFRGGRHWDMRMEGVAKDHGTFSSAQDIADVASYVNGLERDGKRGIGFGDRVDLGRRIYEGRCASCHGANGEGDARREIPRLSGQHAAYLSRQIYDAVDGRRPALSASHGRRLKPLTFDGVLGVADYLSRIGWQQDAPVGE
ncbi:MAG TPA: c-type cytochrome [Steroidobacteraceae bacterium]|nr:c-type cytochrome [Steroidobacteraceae bacterium]